MHTRIAINGFGRIGRAAFKIALESKALEVVAINDLTDTETLAHLLQFDSVYGKYNKKIESTEKEIIVDGTHYPVLSEKEPDLLPWKEMKVDIVIESTGRFTTKEKAGLHIKAGAKTVIISAPPKGKDVGTVVLSVNEKDLKKYASEGVVSNASCTTNCIAPVAKVIDDAFGIEKAMMTTVHSYTADQNLVDGPHKDLRRARAAAYNIVPTTTGAAISTTETIPNLAGKFDGLAIRVPTIVGSLADFTFLLKKNVTVEEVNETLENASKQKPFAGILAVTHDPVVSSDIIGNPHSSIVDLELTKVVDGNMLKVIAWYDNEWGYSQRLVQIVEETAQAFS